MALAGRLHVEHEVEGVATRKLERGTLQRRAAGMLQHAGDAEPAQLATPLRFLAPLLETVDVCEFERLVDNHREFAGVVDGADRGFVGNRLGRNQVALAQAHAVDAGEARGLVDHALERIVRLRPAGAAIGRGRRGVGEQALHADVDLLDVVHAGEAAREIERLQIGADRADISAQIGEVAHPQGEEMPVLVERKLDLGHSVARVCVVEKRLRPTRHPVHRALDALGADKLGDVFRIGAGLHAKRAADVFGDDAQFVLRDVHHRSGVVAQRAGTLRAHPQMVAVARCIVARGGAARLHGGVRQPLVGHGDMRDVLGRGNDALDLARVGVGIGMRPGPVHGEIAGRLLPQLRRALGLRRAHGNHRVERLVVDLDQVGGVLRRKAGLGDHHRDGLADIHHALARKCASVRHIELAAAAAGKRRMTRHAADAGRVNVRAGQDCEHAAHLLRRVGVDAVDAGVRVRRAHEGGGDLAGFGGIGDKAAGAAQEIVVLDARITGVMVGGLGIHADSSAGGTFRGLRL